MAFILLIFFTALLMESIGTFISVFGLGALFSGDPVILTMAIILDVAKIVSVSFLYQYWPEINRAMRYYMLSAVIVLMLITTAGSFGYLSAAFQKAIQPAAEVALKVDSYKREQASLTAERDQLTKRNADIDQQIAQLPSNYVSGRQRLIDSFKPETNRISKRLITINQRLDDLNSQILMVENENIDKTVHVGPIMYVSKAFNISVEEASKWIILTINGVFDPLAVILIVAGNFLVKRRKREIEQPKASLRDIQFDEPEQPKGSFREPEFIDQDLTVPTLVEPQHKDEEPLTDEERELISKIYDDVDTGEEPVDVESSDLLQEAIKNYTPTVPTIDVSPESTYSGSPQVDLIDVNKAVHFRGHGFHK